MRSATTNFAKEEVLKGFDRNTRMIPFIMFSLSRINGTMPYIYIYTYTYLVIDDLLDAVVGDRWVPLRTSPEIWHQSASPEPVRKSGTSPEPVRKLDHAGLN